MSKSTTPVILVSIALSLSASLVAQVSALPGGRSTESARAVTDHVAARTNTTIERAEERQSARRTSGVSGPETSVSFVSGTIDGAPFSYSTLAGDNIVAGVLSDADRVFAVEVEAGALQWLKLTVQWSPTSVLSARHYPTGPGDYAILSYGVHYQDQFLGGVGYPTQPDTGITFSLAESDGIGGGTFAGSFDFPMVTGGSAVVDTHYVSGHFYVTDCTAMPPGAPAITVAPSCVANCDAKFFVDIYPNIVEHSILHPGQERAKGHFKVHGQFVDFCPCCQYRQYYQDRTQYFGFPLWPISSPQEDDGNSHASCPLTRRYGIREVPNCPVIDEYTPDRASGCEYRNDDAPRSSWLFELVPWHWEVQYFAKLLHKPTRFSGCTDITLVDKRTWTLCEYKTTPINAAPFYTDCSFEVPMASAGGPTTGEVQSTAGSVQFLGCTQLSVMGLSLEASLQACLQARGDTLALTVESHCAQATVDTLWSRAMGVTISVPSLQPKPSMPASPYAADGDARWVKMFFFQKPQTLPDAFAGTISGLEHLIVFNIPTNGTVTSVPTLGPKGAGWSIRPDHNPASRAVSFSCEVPTSSICRVRVFDLSGRCVRDVTNSWLPAGTHEIQWDARAESGASVPAGMYFVRLNGGQGRADTKVVLTN